MKEKTTATKNGDKGKDEKFDWSRQTGPDPRDPRNVGPPCMGSHDPARSGRGSPSGSNAHGCWTACSRCKMRLMYVPAFGAHALTRKAGALPANVEKQVQELGNEAAYDSKLRDKDIGLDAAERSCMAKLEKIRVQKAEYHKEKKPEMAQGPIAPQPKAKIPPTATVVNLEEADNAMLPGRKGRRMEAPEELEAAQREEMETPKSFTMMAP